MKLFITLVALIPLIIVIANAVITKLKNDNLDMDEVKAQPFTTKTRLILVTSTVVLFLVQFGVFKVASNETGHVDLKVGTDLNPGQIIAYDGQKGKQADIVMPGWHWDPLYPWVKSVEMVNDLVVKPGEVAILTANDGAINKEIVAPKWGDEIDTMKMLTDYRYFLKNSGTRGVQQIKLTTGTYKINRYQWDVNIVPMVRIQTGEVLVIESIFGKSAPFVETTDDEILAVPLVDSDEYRGIVNKPNPAGLYGIHPYTEKAVTVPVGLQTFIYKGGYTSKVMDLVIDAENDKLQVLKDQKDIEEGGHGPAFAAKTKDNHTVYIGVRVIGQVEPRQAPRFAGTIKDVKYLDDKIIEPYTKNILMNIIVKYSALELKDQRERIGVEISNALRARTEKTGFRTKSVEITDLDIPPIVLISGKIESASQALKSALEKKESAVQQAIKVRNLQAQAEKQGIFAEAEVQKKAAKEQAEKIKTLADAEKYRRQQQTDADAYDVNERAKANNFKVKQQADAAKYLADQVGKETVGSLMLQEKINESADKFKVPQTLFITGGESNSKDAKDIVSAHMISKSIKDGLKGSIK